MRDVTKQAKIRTSLNHSIERTNAKEPFLLSLIATCRRRSEKSQTDVPPRGERDLLYKLLRTAFLRLWRFLDPREAPIHQ